MNSLDADEVSRRVPLSPQRHSLAEHSPRSMPVDAVVYTAMSGGVHHDDLTRKAISAIDVVALAAGYRTVSSAPLPVSARTPATPY